MQARGREQGSRSIASRVSPAPDAVACVQADMSNDTVVSLSSAEQLRREAGKARRLAEEAYIEEQRAELSWIAETLEREAEAIECAARKAAERPQIR